MAGKSDDKQHDDKQDGDRKPRQSDERVEWIVAAFASLLVLALVGYLLFIAVTDTGGPPRLLAEIDEIDASRPGYVVVTVRNEGESSAADVVLAGTLADGETAEATLDYSPANSQTGATLVFPRSVTADEMEIRVKGFGEP